MHQVSANAGASLPKMAVLPRVVYWRRPSTEEVRINAEDVARTITQFQARVRELEAEVAALKGAGAG